MTDHDDIVLDRPNENTKHVPKPITAEEFDALFDAGEDITPYLDIDNPIRVKDLPKRANVDFSPWMIEQLDAHAKKIGVARQALIKLWLAEKLEQLAAREK